MTLPTFGRSRLVRRAGQLVLTAGLLGLVGWSVAGQWADVPGVLDQLSVPGLTLAGLAAGVANCCGFLAWRAVLADFGAQPPLQGAARIFFVGQLAKYLPGKVWPILIQARLGRAYRIPGRASAAAALLAMLITLGTGLLLTAAALPVLGDRVFDSFWWTLLTVPLALVVLWPPLLNRTLARLLRLAHREPMPQPLSARGIAGAVGWSVATWLAYGIHLWLLLTDIGAAGPELLVRSVGAFAGAWSIGFLLAIAPAGVGPREAALPMLLGVTVAQPAALVVAVVSRLLLTVVDLLLPAVTMLVGWSARHSLHPSGEASAEPGPVRAAAPLGPQPAEQRRPVDSAHSTNLGGRTGDHDAPATTNT